MDKIEKQELPLIHEELTNKAQNRAQSEHDEYIPYQEDTLRSPISPIELPSSQQQFKLGSPQIKTYALDQLKTLETISKFKPPAPDPVLANQGLIEAKSIPAGACLTPPQYNYNPNSQFNHYMGLEAEYISDCLGDPLKSLIDVDFIKDSLDSIASVRQTLEIEKTGDTDIMHGRGIEQIKRDQQMIDYISAEGRHALVFDKALQRINEKRISLGFIDINEKELLLSRVGGTGRENQLGVYHPFRDDSIKIKNYALQKLANAFSHEPWDLNQIAESYRLLCHGTPYMNGTPSIIETFLDAMFRARGWALPSKVNEPFWDAIFHDDKNGPYTWELFMKNYKAS